MSTRTVPLSPFSKLYTGQSLSLTLLVLCVLGSALTLVYTKHQSRRLHTTLQQLQNSKDTLHAEWTKLLLEEGTLSSDILVEKIAREKLGMIVPPNNQVMVIKP